VSSPSNSGDAGGAASKERAELLEAIYRKEYDGILRSAAKRACELVRGGPLRTCRSDGSAAVARNLAAFDRAVAVMNRAARAAIKNGAMVVAMALDMSVIERDVAIRLMKNVPEKISNSYAGAHRKALEENRCAVCGDDNAHGSGSAKRKSAAYQHPRYCCEECQLVGDYKFAKQKYSVMKQRKLEEAGDPPDLSLQDQGPLCTWYHVLYDGVLYKDVIERGGSRVPVGASEDSAASPSVDQGDDDNFFAEDTCAMCFAPGARVLCPKCGIQAYCSFEHMERDGPDHSLVCPGFVSAALDL
jgi:hypothetical protein